MDNPDRLGGAETNTVTRELVVTMVTEASLVVLTVRNTQPEQIGPDQTRRLEEIMSQQSGLVVRVTRVLPSLVTATNGSCCEESSQVLYSL